jgi:peptidoglycan hydrolase-like protein with peptidoglycan-binding domain
MALLDHIDTPDTPIQSVMTSVTRDVYVATKERQRPWVNASLISEVYLNPTPAAAGSPPPASEPASAPTEVRPSDEASIAWDREKILFQSAEKSGAVEDYQAYLAAYPQGQFASIAQNYIARASHNAVPTGNAAPAGNIAAAGKPATDPALTVAALPQADTTRTSEASTETVVAPAAAAPQGGTSVGEAALGWDKAKRREVQVRLELTGREVGSIDGNLGARTRTAMGDWQRQNGFDATGFFTAEQFQLLAAQTDEAYNRQTEAATAPAKPRRNSTAMRDKASAEAKAKTGSKNTAKAKKSGSTEQAQSKRRINQAQTEEPPANTPKRQRAGQVDLGFGNWTTIYSDDPCLTHPGHRILDGRCSY